MSRSSIPAAGSSRTLWPSPASPRTESAPFPCGDGAAHSSPAVPGVSSPGLRRKQPSAPSLLASPPDSSAPRSAALLLMSVPTVIRGLPGLSAQQRRDYPDEATTYLRWLAWQDRRPDGTTLASFLQRQREREVSSEALTVTREALAFLHDIVLRIPSTTPQESVCDAVWCEADIEAVLAQLGGTHRLMARMIFEAGLTPTEAAYIRVGDLQLGTPMGTPGTIVVRDGAGRCDRAVTIDAELADALRVQRARVRTLYRSDREAGYGEAPLPPDVEVHFPGSGDGWEWQFLFPHEQRRRDVRTGREVRDSVGPDHVLSTMRAVLHAETRFLPAAGDR